MTTKFAAYGGKYDGIDRNCKFAGNPRDTLEEAMEDWRSCKDYPWSEIQIYQVSEDGQNYTDIITLPRHELGR